jgi:hypothetical protein
LLPVTPLAPKILRLSLDFGKILDPCCIDPIFGPKNEVSGHCRILRSENYIVCTHDIKLLLYGSKVLEATMN